VRGFLTRLVALFDKQKVHGQLRETSPRNFIYTLFDNLNDRFAQSANVRARTLTRSYGLKDVKLKWRNFVDDDEDNSKEEKYVKKAILDILKHKQTSDYLSQELLAFYQIIEQNCKAFISSMVRLLRILFTSRDIMEGRKQQSKTALKVLKYLSEYIEFRGSRGQEAEQGKQEIQLIASTL
jgi:hypothetical protein